MAAEHVQTFLFQRDEEHVNDLVYCRRWTRRALRMFTFHRSSCLFQSSLAEDGNVGLIPVVRVSALLRLVGPDRLYQRRLLCAMEASGKSILI